MIKTSADTSKLNELLVQKHPIYSLDGKLFLFTTMSHLQVIIRRYSKASQQMSPPFLTHCINDRKILCILLWYPSYAELDDRNSLFKTHRTG